MSMFSGRIQLKTMDMINTTATTFCAKTDCMIDGKISQIPLSLAVVNPIRQQVKEIGGSSRGETNYYYKKNYGIIIT